jgi:hypothetical protein
MAPSVTLLELINAVSAFARTDDEIVATVVHLVNSGAVRLGGSFKDRRIDLGGDR